MLAAINVARLLAGGACIVPPPTTALGSLMHYISDPQRRDFQPMNANFGLLDPLPPGAKVRKDAKKQALVDRAQREFAEWVDQAGLVGLGTVT